MWKKPAFCLLATLGLGLTVSYGLSADSVSNKILGFPSRFFGRVQSKAADLDHQVTLAIKNSYSAYGGFEYNYQRIIIHCAENAAGAVSCWV